MNASCYILLTYRKRFMIIIADLFADPRCTALRMCLPGCATATCTTHVMCIILNMYMYTNMHFVKLTLGNCSMHGGSQPSRAGRTDSKSPGTHHVRVRQTCSIAFVCAAVFVFYAYVFSKLQRPLMSYNPATVFKALDAVPDLSHSCQPPVTLM